MKERYQLNMPNHKWYGLSFWLPLSISLCLIAFGAIALWIQMQDQRTTLLQQERERAELAANTLLYSLETLMLAGDGYLARDWLNRIAQTPDIETVQVVRANGDEAFRDLTTIQKINAFLGQQRFQRHPSPSRKITDISPNQLANAISGNSVHIGDFTENYLTHLLPIRLHAQCRTCHGTQQQPIIAILRLTTNLNSAKQRIERIVSRDLIMNLATILAVSLLLYILVFHWVIAPIKKLSAAVKRITTGAMDTQIDISHNDELGMLGLAMNEMAISLRQTMVSRNFVNSITESMLNALFVLDQDGIIKAVNPAACKLLEYKKDELIGQPINKILAINSQLENFCGGLEHNQEVHEIEQGFLSRNGIEIPVLISSGPIQGMQGSRVCVAQSLSEYRRIEHAMQLSHQGLLEVVMKHHTGIMVANLAGQVLFANPAARALLGQELKRLPKSIVDPLSTQRINEIDIIKDQQRQGVAKLNVTEIDWENQRAFLVILDDVTERKIAEANMVHMVYHDALTGLPNRIMFVDCVTQALTRNLMNKETLAVLCLDIDRFKAINDTLGHTCGDELLQEVAARLQDAVRKGDTVARMGSDEFTVLLESIKLGIDIEFIVRKIFRAFNAPFHIQDHTLYVTFSIGISLFPDDSNDPELLIKYADTAMHHAKEQGNNQICTYQVDFSDRIATRLLLERQLREALEQGQFSVFYQPQINMENGKLIGLEALLRWHHPKDGLVSIGPFVSVLEDTGLIIPVGAWVLEETCQQLRLWQDAGLQVVPVSVNLSALQLKNCDIIATVESCLVGYDIPGNLLGLEITESAIMTNMNEAISLLSLLSEQGIVLSIDDFGTGYSSLSVLRQLPVQIVKLDRSFVQEITYRQQDAALAAAVIAMAHGLGKQVVAEGIETKEQQALLMREHCDYGQGYLFGRPMPADKIVELFNH